MIKVHILTTCEYCHGEAYLPFGEVQDYLGRPYTRYCPCPVCNGSGNQPKWVPLQELAKLLNPDKCPHQHTSFEGGMHFSAGEVWDDIEEVCDQLGTKKAARTTWATQTDVILSAAKNLDPSLRSG